MDQYGLNKDGVIMTSFILWLSYLGGSTMLHLYPPRLVKGDQQIRLPMMGDGNNWYKLAERLASIGVLTVVPQGSDTYQITLAACHTAVVVAPLKYLKRVLRKGFVASATQKIDNAL